MAGHGELFWRKSTRSSSGDCVEIAVSTGVVLVRDSKNPDGPVLEFEPAVFSAFLADLKATP